MSNEKWTNRDWKWLMGIFVIIIFSLVLSIIIILSFKLSNDANISNMLSIATGLTSLIVSIIAIFYAFTESKKSSEQNIHTQNTLHEIDSAVLDLKNAISKVESIKNDIIDLKNNTDNNYNKLFLIVNNLHEKFETNIAELRNNSDDKELIDIYEEKMDMEFNIIKSALITKLSKLDNDEQRILRFRFGLDDGRPRSKEEVSEIMNIKTSQVGYIETKALSKLRKMDNNDIMSELIIEKIKK